MEEFEICMFSIYTCDTHWLFFFFIGQAKNRSEYLCKSGNVFDSDAEAEGRDSSEGVTTTHWKYALMVGFGQVVIDTPL